MSNFDLKWKTESEPSLVRYGWSKTQRQFVYQQYWKLLKNEIDKIFPEHKKGLSCVEVGSGRGTLSQYMKNEGFKEKCIDREEEALKVALSNGLSAEKGDGEKLEYPNDIFDVAFSVGVLEHMDWKKGLGEMYRVAKPNGLVVNYIMPHKSSMRDLNIFSTQKDYHRENIKTEELFEFISGLKPKYVDIKIVNSYPLFTPIPKWFEFICASLWHIACKIKGFGGSKKWSQTLFVAIQKSENNRDGYKFNMNKFSSFV